MCLAERVVLPSVDKNGLERSAARWALRWSGNAEPRQHRWLRPYAHCICISPKVEDEQ